MSSRILIAYYSTWGHIRQLAEEFGRTLKESGVHVDLKQIKETLPAEVLTQMHAAPRSDDPVLEVDELKDYDGIVFAFPTRYGRAPAQASVLFDSTGALWRSRALVGKFTTIITASGTQHGGQETTQFTTLPFFVHHGMIYVPPGYLADELKEKFEIVGGSPWGSGTIGAPDNSRQPSEKEKAAVATHAKHFGKVVSTYVKGSKA